VPEVYLSQRNSLPHHKGAHDTNRVRIGRSSNAVKKIREKGTSGLPSLRTPTRKATNMANHYYSTTQTA